MTWGKFQKRRLAAPSVLTERDPHKEMAGTKPGHHLVNTIGVEEVTANSYFLVGAILESAGLASGFASGLASGFAMASAGASMRSTLAVWRNFAT